MRRRRNLDAMLMTTTLVLVAAVLVVLSVRIITTSDVRDQAVFVPFGDLTKPDAGITGPSETTDGEEALIDRHYLHVDEILSPDNDYASSDTEPPTTQESAAKDTAEPTTTAAAVKTTSGTTTTVATTPKTTTTRDPEAFESVDIRYYANSENGLNLREKPSTKAPVLRKLDYGTPLRVIGLNSEWAKVRLAGYEIGYVSRDFITKYRPVTEPPTTTTTTTTTVRPKTTAPTSGPSASATTKPTPSSTAAPPVTTATQATTVKPPSGSVSFVNPPSGGSNAVARTNHALLKQYGLINKEGSSSINRHYETFTDNGNGTITVDGVTISYVQLMPGRRATHYDGVAVCRHSIAVNGGVCFAGHTTPTCHGTACGLLAQRGIVAVPQSEIGTYPRGTVVFVIGYGMAVVGDRSGSHFDVCYDADECSKLTRRNWTNGIYIITSP